MTETAKQMTLEGFDDACGSVETVIKWLARSYPVMEEWKKKGKDIFFSLNGDSVVARTRLASVVRSYFVESTLAPESVSQWKKASTEVEQVTVAPPKITVANSAYVDWLHVADYILLACATVSDELLAENTQRDAEYRQVSESFRIRSMVYHAREAIRENPTVSDADLLKQLGEKHKKIGLVHIKEARKLEQQGARFKPLTEPVQPKPIERYEPIYFGKPQDAKNV